MNKFMYVFLILSLFLAGCWDRRELNQLAITLSIGIDKIEDEYEVSAQVVIPSEMSMNGSSGSAKVTLYTARGESIFEALRKMTKESPRKLYIGHLRMLLIGEELAKEGIGEPLDFLIRDGEPRPDFYVVLTRDTSPTEILSVTTTLESIPANKMFSSLSMSEKAWAGTKSVNLDKLVSAFISEGKEAVITGIQLIGDPKTGTSKKNVEMISPNASIQYDNLAVFKGDKLIGWLTEKETIAYNYITDSVETTVRPIACPKEGIVTIEIIQSNSDMKGTMNEGKPHVEMNVNVQGNVGSVECKINLTQMETIEELEKIFENEVTEMIQRTITSVQKNYQSDIFGFGEAIHRSNPKEWHNLKDHWEEEFSDLTVNVNVELKILRTGTINNSFLEKIKE